jgi:type III pantothenate kinase
LVILLDCGNSSLKAQLREDGRVQASFSCAYRDGWIDRLQRWLAGLPVSHCYLSSVLDSARQARLDSCLGDRFGEAVTRFVSTARGGGVTNAYEQPERLGVDRWLALIGALSLVDGDCIVIDAGSAITLDLLRADGRHLGGAILPGINTSAERFRQIFGYIDFDDPLIGQSDEPGCSTEAAIQLDYARDSMQGLRELVNRWGRRLDQDAGLLLAGGDAERVQRELGVPGRIVPDLVFLGMSRLARE